MRFQIHQINRHGILLISCCLTEKGRDSIQTFRQRSNSLIFAVTFYRSRRGLTPPHRVKSISMAKFTNEELEFIRAHGNEECAKTWLGLWDSKRTIKQDHRDFMIDKYERKR